MNIRNRILLNKKLPEREVFIKLLPDKNFQKQVEPKVDQLIKTTSCLVIPDSWLLRFRLWRVDHEL